MRDCKKCKHLVMFDYKNKSYSCEKWECKFEPKEQEPTTKNDLGVDYISRKAILDELEKWDWQELYLPIHFKQMIDELPSETPQEPIIDKIRAEIDGLRKDALISWASSEMIIDTILEILDKYKADKEQEDDNT